MKLTNKTINYKLKEVDSRGNTTEIDDAADVQLPSIEKITDTIKGAGIMGEIDLPGYGQISSMTMTINYRADNPKYAALSRPGQIKLELVWVSDVLDSSNMSVKPQQHKVFATVLNKKYDPGKVEVGATMDGSSEFEVVQYRKLVDGREVLNVDKLNSKYVVNGIDYMESIRTALS